MNAKGAIFTGAALFVAYSLFRKSQAAGDLFYYPDRVYKFEFDGLTPVVTCGLRVQNTSNQSFNLYSFAANVKSDGYVVGNAFQFQPQSVNPNSESVVIVKLRLFPLSLVNEIVRAFESKNFTKELEVDGQMNVDNLQVPVKLKYKVGLGT